MRGYKFQPRKFELYWELGFQSDHKELILSAIKKITELEAVDLECKPKNKKIEIVRKSISKC